MLNPLCTWTDLVKVIIILALAWIMLYFLREIIRKTFWFGKHEAALLRVVEGFILLFEPTTVFAIITTFVFIQPTVHGLILLLLVIGGYKHLRNYLSGRIVRFDERIKLGKKLKIDNITGVISEKKRLGIRLKTGKGLQFVNYSYLLEKGFMLLSDDEIGGFYTFRLRPKDELAQQKVNHVKKIQNLLLTAPFLDRNYKPEITAEDKDIKAQISVREKTHLKELRKLVEEYGYHCQIIK